MPSEGKKTGPREVNLESLARGHTEICIKRLAGFCVSPQVEPTVSIRAIELMLDRGWGTVEQRHKVISAGTGAGGQFVVQLIMPEKI
jgi:hypothetical protein